MVICKICLKKFHFVSNTHVKNHNLTLKEYISRFGNNIKSNEYKKRAYRNHSKTMSEMRRSGRVVPPPMSLETRKLISERMKLNNPMKNPIIARKVSLMRKGLPGKSRTLEQRQNISKSKLGILNPRWTGGEKPPVYLLWNKDRKLALERDNYRCVRCNLTNKDHNKKYKKGLHVHHIKPYKKYKDSSIKNLITLCVQCHLKEEAKLKNKIFSD